ncbi:MAG: 3-dehydroquinate synthase [Sphingomonadales bacterium]
MTAEVNIKNTSGGTQVLIGSGVLAKAGTVMAARFAGRKVAIISDETVAALYLDVVEKSLKDAGFETGAVIVSPGEASKSFATLEKVCGKLLAFGLERGDAVMALGGGVVGDLAGLAASLVRRGVNLVMAPTTLLAQVDSSIGGKTAINTALGKNLVGTIYPAKLVISDTGTLNTLPGREMRAGYAEIVKHAILAGVDHFAFLEAGAGGFFAGDQKIRAETIQKSITVKAAIVEADEREDGPRLMLNLGHTFGHALEAIAGFDGTLLHGEAVAFGLVLAFQYAAFRGRDVSADLARVMTLLEKAGLATTLKKAGLTPPAKALLGFMTQDKKNVHGAIRLVVPRAIGDVTIEEAALEDLDQFLQTVNT